MIGVKTGQQSQSSDSKDIRMAGCDVHLTFHQTAGNQWAAEATFRCGVEDKQREESTGSGPCATREEAEQRVLGRVSDMLGHNVDRHTSRVNNPTEEHP